MTGKLPWAQFAPKRISNRRFNEDAVQEDGAFRCETVATMDVRAIPKDEIGAVCGSTRTYRAAAAERGRRA